MSNPKSIGLFFGSFNPIHIGHLLIAAHIIENSTLDQIWFVVSPHNPLKDKKTLLNDHHRLTLVNTAIEDDLRFKASDIEFKLPQPSYTANTLAHLKEKYPQHTFALIMGSDTLNTLNKWHNYQYLLEHYQIYVYPRPHHPPMMTDCSNIIITNAPFIEISASQIRALINNKQEFRYYVPDKVYAYIKEMNFYKKKS